MKINERKSGWIRGAAILAVAFAPYALAAEAGKVGVLVGDPVSPFGQVLAAGFREAAAEHGLSIVIKSPPSAENVAQEQRLVAGWIADPDIRGVIIACGVGGTELARSVEPLRARGVKVVAYLGQMPPGVASSTVLVDEGTVIGSAVDQCVRLLRPGGELAMLRSNVRQGEVNDRERLAIEGIRRRVSVAAIHADIYMNVEGRTVVDQARLLLQKYPRTNVVYSPYSSATVAMITALRESGQAGRIHHVGIGAGIPPECAAALREGELDAWIALDPADVAKKAMTVMADALAGKDVPPVVLSNVKIVTKEALVAGQPQAATN